MLRPVSLIHIYRSFSAVLLFSMLLVSCSSVSTPISNNSQPEAEIIQNSATVTVTQNPTVTTTPTVQPTQSFPVIAGTTIPTPMGVFQPANNAYPVQLARWGKGAIYQLLLSPNQKTLAVATSTGVYLYDASTLEEVSRVDTNGIIANSIQFSQDGNLLAVAESELAVHIFSLTEKRFLYHLGNPESEISLRGGLNIPEFFTFSSDGKNLWMCSDKSGHFARRFDLSDGLEKQSISLETDRTCIGLFLANDEKNLVYLDTGNLVILDVSSGKELLRIPAEVNKYSISPDHSILILESDKIVSIIDCTGSKTLGRINKNGFDIDHSNDRLYKLKISPANNSVALLFGTGDLCIWDIETNKALPCLPVNHYERFYGMGFNQDGTILYSYSNERIARWESNTWVKIDERLISNTPEEIISLEAISGFLTLEKNNITGQSVIALWTDESKPRAILDASTGIKEVLYSPDGTGLISLTAEKITLWNTKDQSVVQSIDYEAETAAISFDGKTLAAALKDNSIQLFSLPDLDLLAKSQVISSPIRKLQFSTDNANLIISGEKDVTILTIADGKLLSTIKLDKPLLGAMPSGKSVITLDKDLKAILWGTENGKEEGKSSSLVGKEKSPLAIDYGNKTIGLLGAESFKLITVGDYGEVRWDQPLKPSYPTLFKMSRNSPIAVVGVENGVQLIDTTNQSLLGLIKQDAASFDISAGGDIAIAKNNEISIWPIKGKSQKSITDFGMLYNPANLLLVNNTNELFTSEKAAQTGTYLLSGYGSGLNAYDPLNGSLETAINLSKDILMATSPDQKFTLYASSDFSTNDPPLRLAVTIENEAANSVNTPAAGNDPTPTGKNSQKKLVSPDATFHSWNSISVSNTGLAAASFYGNDKALIGLWSIDSDSIISKIPQKSERVAISADGKILAAEYKDDKYKEYVVVYDIANPKNPSKLISLNMADLLSAWEGISSLVFSPDGKWLALGSSTGSIVFVDTVDWQKKFILTGHVEPIVGLVFTADNNLLYSSSQDGTIRVWGMSSRPDLLPTATPTPLPTVTPTSEPSGKPISNVSQSDLAKLNEDNINRLTALNRWQVGGRSIYGGCFGCIFYFWNMHDSPDPQVFLNLSGEKDTFYTLSLFSNEKIRPKTMPWSISPDWAALSPDGKTIAGATNNSPLISLFSSTGNKIKNLVGHSLSDGNNVAFTSDGHFLASVTNNPKSVGNNEIIIWDMQKNGAQKAKTRINDGYVRSIAFKTEADGNYQLFVGLVDKPEGSALRRFGLTADGQLSELEGVGGFTAPGVVALAFSPDGTFLAIALDDGSWRIVNSETMQDMVIFPPEEAIFEGKNDPANVLAIGFLPEGKGILTSHYDGSFRLWGVKAK